MSDSPVSLGQAISIIGGSPILKNVLGHTVDKLKIARHIDVGNVPGMSGIMAGIVQGGGIGSLLQSPLGSALAPLTSALTAGQTTLTTSLGADGSALVNALGNLSGAATRLSSLADNLVGAASTSGLPTQFDAIGHMNLAQSIGTTLPSSMSETTAFAPATSAGVLANTLPAVQGIITRVGSGAMSVSAAIAATNALQASIDAITNASVGAITSLQTLAPALAAGQSTVAILAAGSPAMISAMQAAIRPDMMGAVQQIVAAHEGAMAASLLPAAAAADDVATAVAAAEAGAPAA